MNDKTPTNQDDCEPREYCVGELKGTVCGEITMHCDCGCCQYEDMYHIFPANLKREDVLPQSVAQINAIPGNVKFGSLLDLGHVGWLLHMKKFN